MQALVGRCTDVVGSLTVRCFCDARFGTLSGVRSQLLLRLRGSLRRLLGSVLGNRGVECRADDAMQHQAIQLGGIGWLLLLFLNIVFSQWWLEEVVEALIATHIRLVHARVASTPRCHVDESPFALLGKLLFVQRTAREPFVHGHAQ